MTDQTAQDRMDKIADTTQAWSDKNIADGGVCDFCCAELIGQPVVTYTTDAPIIEEIIGIADRNDVGGITHVSDEFWATCSDCDKVIQTCLAGSVPEPAAHLAEHVADTANYARIGVERSPYEVARLTRFYREFFARNPVRSTPEAV